MKTSVALWSGRVIEGASCLAPDAWVIATVSEHSALCGTPGTLPSHAVFNKAQAQFQRRGAG